MLHGVKSKKRRAAPGFGILPSEAVVKKPVGKKAPSDDDDEVTRMRELGRALRPIAKVLEETKKGGLGESQSLALEKLLELVRAWQRSNG